jgi:GlpG protein
MAGYMRPIGQLDTEELASVFADYLLVHDIEGQLEPGKGGFTVWVVDEDRVDEAKGLLSRFRSMPDAEEFHKASEAAAERRREEKRAAKEAEKKLKRPGAFPWVMPRGGLTLILLGICVGVGLLTQLGESAEWTRWFMISKAEVQRGQVWRLFTPIFLHFTLWHLLFNLLWLRDFGTILETKIGTWRFAGTVAALALASNLSQYAVAGPNFGGMSGVVYGLFGYLWMRNRVDPHFGVFISPMASGLLMVFLALGIFGLLGPTANAAHLSGLLAGGAMGWAGAKGRRGA